MFRCYDYHRCYFVIKVAIFCPVWCPGSGRYYQDRISPRWASSSPASSQEWLTRVIGDSDLLTIYNAYLAWKRVCMTSGSEYQFCRKNFLSQQTLSNIEDLKGQLIVCLVDSGFLPLTEAERTTLNKYGKTSFRRNSSCWLPRTRFSSRRRQFFDIPQRANMNSDNDLVTTSVIGWSFYPKLLVRDGKGFRNCANNQSISLHPSSVNKGHHELKWLSYYHIMQAKQWALLISKDLCPSNWQCIDSTMLMKPQQSKSLLLLYSVAMFVAMFVKMAFLPEICWLST